MSRSRAPYAAHRTDPLTRDLERLDRAFTLRDEWLGHALSTDPADRPAAEAAIGELYRLIGRKPPRFVWAESPHAAAAALPPDRKLPDLRDPFAPSRYADWPAATLLATEMAALRRRLDRRAGSKWPRPSWRFGPGLASYPTPHEALRNGVDLADLLNTVVAGALRVSVLDGIGKPLRTTLTEEVEDPLHFTWYGQHEAYWVAHYDTYRRLRLAAPYGPPDDHRLDQWMTLVRSCGWWWPGDEVCVVVERPAAVHTESLPAGREGELRLHNAKDKAVQYTDGWGIYSVNGTRVPEWVLTDPTPERIAAEPNIEIRRCAIERLGWDAYIERAGLALVATAADPGNADCELRLYDLPPEPWQAPSRVLLAINGSRERDGRRRRYGLSVPGEIDDPIAAAGWSYGLTGDQYAQLLRRT
ncbi:DUF6745 domain-containing protein [Spirillospora sp. CA-294931]|uniref:DUF6745 domain-containing protein n=1 Tax=Spirillospora sp. CA-294931 TaxID=3240042 RepID=UPI003D94DAC3